MRRVSFQKINERTGKMTFLGGESLPALDFTAMDEMEECLRTIESDPSMRSVVIASDHGRVFLAGGDLKEFAKLETSGDGDAMCVRMKKIIRAFGESRVPMIAAVEGGVFGGGCEFLLGCDIIVASRRASFNFTQAKFGLITGWGGATRFVRIAGRTNAAYALLTASKISAKKGSEFGLVNVLTRSGKAEETAISIAARVAGMPEAAIVSYKKAVRFAERNGFEESVEFERALFGNLWASDGHKKALRDFLSGDGG